MAGVSLTLRVVKFEGHLVFRAPKTYRRFVDSLGDGEERDVIIKPASKRQGTQSMRYLRGVVIPDVAAASGYDDPDDYQEVFEALAWKFLRIADHPEHGYPRRLSTSKDEMDQADMTAFIDKIITYAEAGIPGCRVRRPDEVDDWDKVPDYDWKAA